MKTNLTTETTEAAEPGCCKHQPDTGSARAIQPFLFRKAGSHWDVVFEGRSMFHLRDCLGVRYLDKLLHQPNQPIPAFDLEILVQPERVQARTNQTLRDELDADTVRTYLRELTRLRAQREAAQDDGNEGVVDHLDRDIGALEDALENRTGEVRTAGERARCNVNKAITYVQRSLRRGGAEEKRFAEHLARFVNLGYECAYYQPEGRVWQ